MKILVTGSAGFITGYLIEALLNRGHHVIGIDNFSKYGKVVKSYDNHPRYSFCEGDVKDVDLLKELSSDADQIVAAAAMIGGISYFHDLAYDLLAENERICASTFDAAIWAYLKKSLKRIVVVSSSMVYESANEFPTSEGTQLRCPPPLSTYGFQKLSTEYFAKGAYEQYGLPYTIVRPFNCVGVGEKKAVSGKEIYSGNIQLAMSHVVPDLIKKILLNQDPLHIYGDGSQIRHYTYGGDLAEGICKAMESEKAVNEDFNLSTSVSTTVRELAMKIWKKIKGDVPFRCVSDEPFKYDVQKRVPDCTKAKKILNFEASTSLDAILHEIISWSKEQLKYGKL